MLSHDVSDNEYGKGGGEVLDNCFHMMSVMMNVCGGPSFCLSFFLDKETSGNGSGRLCCLQPFENGTIIRSNIKSDVLHARISHSCVKTEYQGFVFVGVCSAVI